MDEKALRKLREKLDKLLAADRNEEAVVLLQELVRGEPTNPRWTHKRGDLLRRLGRNAEAVDAYAQAVEIYATTGFIARAVAMAKTVIALDPKRIDVLTRVDPNAAQQLHRKARPDSVSMRPPTPRGKVTSQGTRARHAAVVPEDAPPQPAAAGRHPMVLEDDPAPPPARAPARHPMVLEDDPVPEPAPPPVAARAAGPTKPRVAPVATRITVAASSGAARPAPPQPTAAAESKRVVTLDQLSLPPPKVHDAPTVRLIPSVPPPEPESTPTARPSAPPDPELQYEPPQDESELFSDALEGVIELSVAPDVAPNETRFSNAPPSPALALSAAEVSERPAAASDPDQDALQPTADVLSGLPLFPLFAEVPPEVLSEMITGTELVELDDGDFVMRKGDPGDALYGIIEGSVAINVPGQTYEHMLAEGDVFGESCLLQDEPRHADARVKGRLMALRIPRDTLLRMLRGHPPLAELLLEMLTRRLLGNLLRSSPLFQEFDSEGRRTLSTMFEVRRAAAGTRLAVAGKRMDGLYISLTGTLLIEAPGSAARIAPPGSMFGQHTLLSREPAPASVTARVNLVVLRLPAATFTQVAMQYPMILARLAELSTDEVVSVTL